MIGYKSSIGNNTTGDDNTSEDGVDSYLGAISSSVISLTTNSPTGAAESGLYGTSDDSRDNYSDLTIDFGFVKRMDMGDLPDASASTAAGNYETTSSDNGPSHWTVAGLTLGSYVDDEYEGQPNTLATGDDNAGYSGNIALLGTASQSSTYYTANANLAIDGNTNGDMNLGSVSHTNNNPTEWWRVDLPTNAQINQIVVWNRTDCCSSRLDNALVEILNASGATVWSGNIAASAPTTSTFNVGTITGKTVKISLSTSTNLQLAEVQVFGTIDDEEGVTIPTLFAGQVANLSVTVAGATSGAKLNSFFDWNNDGDFADANEAIAQMNVVNGNNTLAISVPLTAATNTSIGARFRLSSTGGLTATGSANDGEVEDYMVSVIAGSVGNYVWNDTNGNGLQDEGAASGINGITVELYKETSAGSGTYTLSQTTTTANDGSGNAGYYNFIIGQNANYYVKFPVKNGTTALTTQTATAATDGNSDANAFTGVSPIFAIDVNGTGTARDNPTIDAGYIPCNLNPSILKSNDLSCAVPTATLTASPATGVTYLWDNGSTGATRAVNAAGTYVVTVSSLTNFCVANASVTVTSTISNPPCAPLTIQKTK